MVKHMKRPVAIRQRFMLRQRCHQTWGRYPSAADTYLLDDLQSNSVASFMLSFNQSVSPCTAECCRVYISAHYTLIERYPLSIPALIHPHHFRIQHLRLLRLVASYFLRLLVLSWNTNIAIEPLIATFGHVGSLAPSIRKLIVDGRLISLIYIVSWNTALNLDLGPHEVEDVWNSIIARLSFPAENRQVHIPRHDGEDGF